MNKFELELRRAPVIILDGCQATQLESMDCEFSGALWSAQLLESNPRTVVPAHRTYLDAGAKPVGGCCRNGPHDIAAMRLFL